MILESTVIEFKGLPLFQKAKFKTPMDMQGSILDFACFFYLIKGNMLSYDSRGLTKIGENEAVIKNCNNYIQRYKPSTDTEECEAIAIYLYPELLKEIYKDEVPSFLVTDDVPTPKKIIGNQLVEQYIANLSIFFQNKDAFDDELGVLKLKELVIIMLKSENHQNVRKLLSEIFSPVDLSFKESIQRNILNPLSIEQLSFICNMSLSTFKREFKKVFKETPAKYIKHKRLEYASDLLKCNSLKSISEIAYDSGFQDPTTFSANFKEKFELSPKEYRLTFFRK